MFKKIFTIILCLLALFSCYAINATPVFSAYAESYEVYFNDYSTLENVYTVDKISYLLCFNKKGESCAVNNGVTAKQILESFNAVVIKVENHEGGKSIYAYSNKIKYKKRMFNDIVNLHIEISENQIRVGTPIIYGSF